MFSIDERLAQFAYSVVSNYRTLRDLVNSKADAAHNHDTQYYTEAEVTSLMAVRNPIIILNAGQTVAQWETAHGVSVPVDAIIGRKP